MSLDLSSLLTLLSAEYHAASHGQEDARSDARLASAVPPRGRLVQSPSGEPIPTVGRAPSHHFAFQTTQDSSLLCSSNNAVSEAAPSVCSRSGSVESQSFEMFFEPALDLLSPSRYPSSADVLDHSADAQPEKVVQAVETTTTEQESESVAVVESDDLSQSAAVECSDEAVAGSSDQPGTLDCTSAVALDSCALGKADLAEGLSSDDLTVEFTPPEPRANHLQAFFGGSTNSGFLMNAWAWLCATRAKAAAKRMRLQETVSLGEKRIVALLEIDGRRFLVGGGSTGVALLAQLDGERDFPALVREKMGSH
ncbi:hypothetical protein DYQ86_00150 [Acidobacteria bacterium AB60]|nr:hypothetical protein DYQ86_00150 [Acidobacteria bacterium AB60]